MIEADEYDVDQHTHSARDSAMSAEVLRHLEELEESVKIKFFFISRKPIFKKKKSKNTYTTFFSSIKSMAPVAFLKGLVKHSPSKSGTRL